jgi:hypothetical protein
MFNNFPEKYSEKKRLSLKNIALRSDVNFINTWNKEGHGGWGSIGF